MLEWLTDKTEDQSSEDAWKLSVNREITRILGFLDKGGGRSARTKHYDKEAAQSYYGLNFIEGKLSMETSRRGLQ